MWSNQPNQSVSKGGFKITIFSFINMTLRIVSYFLKSSDVYWVVSNRKGFSCLLAYLLERGREI